MHSNVICELLVRPSQVAASPAGSGVARNFERGFPNDRAGGLGGAVPQKKWGLGGRSPPENF